MELTRTEILTLHLNPALRHYRNNLQEFSMANPSILQVLTLLLCVASCRAFPEDKNATKNSAGSSKDITPQGLLVFEPARRCAAEAETPGLSGCFFMPEDADNPNSTIIQIYYERLQAADPTKKNLIVLNGGPGGSYTVLFRNPLIAALAESYNIIFYDQRGIGKSSALSENGNHLEKVGLYSTAQNAADLMALIDHLELRDPAGKVTILGHSYGGILAWAFAVKYPHAVDRLLIWNGTTDFSAGLIQTVTKFLFIMHGISGLLAGDTEKPIDGPLAFRSDDQIKIATDSRGSDSFLAMKSSIPKLLDVESLLSLEPGRAHFAMDLLSPLNRSVNRLITCHEFVSPQAMNFFRAWNEFSFEKGHIDAIEGMFQMLLNETCQGIYKAEFDHPFRVTEALDHLAMPILIIGAHKDPLVSILAVRRDYIQAKKNNPRVLYLELHQAGHYPEDQADCVLPHLLRFTSAIENAKPIYGEFHCK